MMSFSALRVIERKAHCTIFNRSLTTEISPKYDGMFRQSKGTTCIRTSSHWTFSFVVHGINKNRENEK